MAGLVLKLRAHERILVNGVVMQNGERSARLIIVTPNVHVLRLRDAIAADAVDTPLRHACYIAQLAVAGELGAEAAAGQLERGIAGLRQTLPGGAGTEHLDAALAHLRRRNLYAVLRALRRLLPAEAAAPAGPDAAGTVPPDREAS